MDTETLWDQVEPSRRVSFGRAMPFFCGSTRPRSGRHSGAPGTLVRLSAADDAFLPALNGRRLRLAGAFSLVEVVVAIGFVAASLVAVLGLLAATTHSSSELSDAQGRACLGGSVQCELERLKDSLGFAGLASAVPPSGSTVPLRLVGTRDGLRVRCAEAADPAANRSLCDPVLSGIANRDRFFLLELTRLPEWETAPDAGFVAVSVRCSWPYKLPVGPATPGASDCDADPAREVPASERHVTILLFAVTP
jgi:hypothetical protein